MPSGRILADFLVALRNADVGEEVVESAKDHILDQIGVQLAASTKPWSVVMRRYVLSLGGAEESTIVGHGDKVKAECAALANATFGHGFELDDTYLPGNLHPGCIVVPSALAVGEKEKIDGARFLASVIAGYEAMGRIGRSAAPSLTGRGFHPTAVVGPFAAAAVTGTILAFDSRTMLNAISIAGSHSSGITEHTLTGGSVKRIHGGIAALGGIRSALLAQAGLDGPPTVLEGNKGFWHAFCDEHHPNKLISNLGTEFIVAGTSFKRYACCHDVHAAIDATTLLLNKYTIRPDDIDEMVMGGNRNSVLGVGTIRDPQDTTAAQFSAAFTLAMCVIKRANGFHDYSDENLADPEIRKLARRVRVELDKEVDAAYPALRSVKVTIRLKNGTKYQEKLDGPRGTPENPITRSEIEGKFRNLTAAILDRGSATAIIEAVHSLEHLRDISELARPLTRPSLGQ
ncbi:MAG: MmgE/PrpD family protein [Chloroflexi bacterium]|nr:MmgE/PrpD family protein [Chloroflexota bacterium]